MSLSAGNVKKPRGTNVGDADRGSVTVFRASYNDRIVHRLNGKSSIPNQPMRTVAQGKIGRSGNRRG